jgi:uncharacterized RDD family membrane protein YckC
MAPAGFWRREAAWTLDASIVAVAALALTAPGVGTRLAGVDAATGALAQRMARLMLDGSASGASPVEMAMAWMQAPAMHAAMAGLQGALWALAAPPLAVFAVLWLAWSVGFESSRWQATPGKRALGLCVVDAVGRRPAPARVLWRHLAGTLSWLTLNIGHAVAALPPAHRSLHDIASATRVCTTRTGAPLPPWTRAWIGLHLLALLAAQVWAVAALQARLLSAFAAAG